MLFCSRCFDGLTCMHVAAKFGAIPIIEILSEMGVSVMIKDTLGATPLHYIHDVPTCQVKDQSNKALHFTGNRKH